MKKKIAIFTGAGISAESGLATFRDSGGLWNNYKPEEIASIHAWERNPELMLEFYNDRRRQMLAAQPNAAHFALGELEKDFDVTIITQNVDDLHERGGSTNVIHLHGELSKVCSEFDKSVTYPYEQDLKLGDTDLNGVQLRPFIVWFGEDVPLITAAQQVVKHADALVVIGTSLNVYPAANLIDCVRPYTPKILINKEHPRGVPMAWETTVHQAYDAWTTMLIESATTGVPKLKNILDSLDAFGL
jgi:NAD-dependent deacetylase